MGAAAAAVHDASDDDDGGKLLPLLLDLSLSTVVVRELTWKGGSSEARRTTTLAVIAPSLCLLPAACLPALLFLPGIPT